MSYQFKFMLKNGGFQRAFKKKLKKLKIRMSQKNNRVLVCFGSTL